jgi:hypothetical protein
LVKAATKVTTPSSREFKTSLIPFLKSYPNNFDIEKDGVVTFVAAFTKLELCPTSSFLLSCHDLNKVIAIKPALHNLK